MKLGIPAVSVIISTFQRPALLDRALASVVAQTYTDFEVWVIDDCSPDEEAVGAVLEKYAGMFAARGIPFYPARLPRPSGYQCVPKNAGIFYSSGEFIAYLDDDNTWEPNHLEELMKVMLAGEADLVYGGRAYINQTDRTDLFHGLVYPQPWDPVKLAQANYIDTSDILHTRGAAWLILREWRNIWDNNLRRFGDWNLLMRFVRLGLVGEPVNAILSTYYWHGENLQLTRAVTAGPVAIPLSTYEKRREELGIVQ